MEWLGDTITSITRRAGKVVDIWDGINDGSDGGAEDILE